MIKIAYGFTPAAETSFKAWIEAVARDGIDAEACLAEAASKLGAMSDPAIYGHHYELRGFYTASKNPETYSFDVSEIVRSEEHTSELQSLMRISYAVFCLKKKNNNIR